MYDQHVDSVSTRGSSNTLTYSKYAVLLCGRLSLWEMAAREMKRRVHNQSLATSLKQAGGFIVSLRTFIFMIPPHKSVASIVYQLDPCFFTSISLETEDAAAAAMNSHKTLKGEIVNVNTCSRTYTGSWSTRTFKMNLNNQRHLLVFLSVFVLFYLCHSDEDCAFRVIVI